MVTVAEIPPPPPQHRFVIFLARVRNISGKHLTLIRHVVGVIVHFAVVVVVIVDKYFKSPISISILVTLIIEDNITATQQHYQCIFLAIR